MNARSLATVLLACAVACDGDDGRPAPDGREEIQIAAGWEARCAPAPPGPFGGTLDQLFLAVATIEPAFAGVYLDDAGRLVIVVTDLARLEPAACAAVAVLGGGLPSSAGAPVGVLGTYGWTELYGWKGVAMRTPVEGLTTIDIDEVRNRIVVGVAPAALVAAAERALEEAGIPREALLVIHEGPVILL